MLPWIAASIVALLSGAACEPSAPAPTVDVGAPGGAGGDGGRGPAAQSGFSPGGQAPSLGVAVLEDYATLPGPIEVTVVDPALFAVPGWPATIFDDGTYAAVAGRHGEVWVHRLGTPEVSHRLQGSTAPSDLVAAHGAIVAVGAHGATTWTYDPALDTFGPSVQWAEGSWITAVTPVRSDESGVVDLWLVDRSASKVRRLEASPVGAGFVGTSVALPSTPVFAHDVYSPRGEGPALGVSGWGACYVGGCIGVRQTWWWSGENVVATLYGGGGATPMRITCLEPEGTLCAFTTVFDEAPPFDVESTVSVVAWPDHDAAPTDATIDALLVPGAVTGVDLTHLDDRPAIALVGPTDASLHVLTVGPHLTTEHHHAPIPRCEAPSHMAFLPGRHQAAVTCLGNDRLLVVDVALPDEVIVR